MIQYRQVTEPVYITKYALTQGILKFSRAKWTDVDDKGYLSVDWSKGRIFVGSKDWTYNLAIAQQRAASMIQRKIKTLQKQLDKLSKFQPTIVEITS